MHAASIPVIPVVGRGEEGTGEAVKPFVEKIIKQAAVQQIVNSCIKNAVAKLEIENEKEAVEVVHLPPDITEKKKKKKSVWKRFKELFCCCK